MKEQLKEARRYAECGWVFAVLPIVSDVKFYAEKNNIDVSEELCKIKRAVYEKAIKTNLRAAKDLSLDGWDNHLAKDYIKQAREYSGIIGVDISSETEKIRVW